MKTLRMYTIGFGLSLALTLAAFWMVEQYLLQSELAFSRGVLLGWLVVLAVGQLVLQLFCFLHLGAEKKPRWNLMSFLFALLVVFILVVGTLWIMAHLNHMQVDLEDIYEGGIISPQTQDD